MNDPQVRLVTVCDLDGEILYSGHRQEQEFADSRRNQKFTRISCQELEDTQSTCIEDWKGKVCLG